MVNIKMLSVAYKDNLQALADLLDGQVMLMFDQASTSRPELVQQLAQ